MEESDADIVVVGANQRSSLASVRDQLFVEETSAGLVLSELSAAGVDQAILLSTCDRVEVQAAAADPDATARAIRSVLAARARMEGAELETQTYDLRGADGLRHMFAVASSLDSSVIGEPQVLGQVKAAHRLSRDHGLVGAALEGALQAAYQCAKRVRTETAVGERPVSIAASALSVAGEVHGDLARLRAAVIGTGEMGELLAEHLLQGGVPHLTILHSRARRAEYVAARLGCHHAAFGLDGQETPELEPATLADSDVVVCAFGTGRLIPGAGVRSSGHAVASTAADVQRRRVIAQRRPIRRSRILTACSLYTLEDLEVRAREGLRAREERSRDAWSIVSEAVDGHLRDRSSRAAVPLVTGLRKRFEAVRLEVLADLGEPGRTTRCAARRGCWSTACCMRPRGGCSISRLTTGARRETSKTPCPTSLSCRNVALSSVRTKELDAPPRRSGDRS